MLSQTLKKGMSIEGIFQRDAMNVWYINGAEELFIVIILFKAYTIFGLYICICVINIAIQQLLE